MFINEYDDVLNAFAEILTPPLKLLQALEGKHISFFGIAGSGKTTLVDRFLALPKVSIVRTPGTTPLGKKIKECLELNQNDKIDADFRRIADVDLVDCMLDISSSMYTYRQEIEPALKNGNIVISDGSLFQHFHKEKGSKLIYEYGDKIIPDLTIHLLCKESTALNRLNKSKGKPVKPTVIFEQSSNYHNTLKTLTADFVDKKDDFSRFCFFGCNDFTKFSFSDNSGICFSLHKNKKSILVIDADQDLRVVFKSLILGLIAYTHGKDYDNFLEYIYDYLIC